MRQRQATARVPASLAAGGRLTAGALATAIAAAASFAVPPVTGLGTAWAQNAVVRVEERQFKAGAGRITFSELPLGTVNPVYPPGRYGGGPDSPTVRFGGHFSGRRLAQDAECPDGAVRTGCLAGTPSAPLSLAGTAPPAKILADRSAPPGTTPGLAGTPSFNGPVAILFDRDVAAVGLDGGSFNAVGSTAITVYDRQGRVLGRTANRGLRFEFLGLATADLSARIAGLEFHLVGAEPAGFGVDNIRFGAPRDVDLPGVRPPAPTPSPPPPPAPPPVRRPPILP